MRLFLLILLNILLSSKNIDNEAVDKANLFEIPRYAKMSDTVFHVGDFIQHNAFLRYPLGPDFMMSKTEKAGIVTSDTTQYRHFLELVDFIKSHPELSFEIGSHTDFRGTAASNVQLSQSRANQIVRVMIEEFGIDSTQISAKGYGREKPSVVYVCHGNYYRYIDDPISLTCNEQAIPVLLTNEYILKFRENRTLHERLHEMNRRTEVKVIGVQH